MAAKFIHKFGKKLSKEFSEDDISNTHLKGAFDDAIKRIPRKDLKKELRMGFDKYYDMLKKIMKGKGKFKGSIKKIKGPKKICTEDEFVKSERRGGLEVEEVKVKEAENKQEQFPWISNVMKELKKPGNVEDSLKVLFEESDSDIQTCLEKQKPNRAKRLALEIRKVLTACYLKLKLNPQQEVTDNILHLFSALLSVYVDLCSEYCIKKVEKKKKYGGEFCTYVRSILVDQMETQLEVILQSDAMAKRNTKFLNPFIRRCIYEQPAPASHHHYLKQVLVIQKVKDRFDETECAELVALAKKLTPLAGFYDWLQNTNSGVLDIIKLKKEKTFKTSKISVHIVLCANEEVIALLNECLLAKSPQDVPAIEDVTEEDLQNIQFQPTGDLFFIDTGKSPVPSVKPSTSKIQKKIRKPAAKKENTIKTIEDLQELIVKDDSKHAKEPRKLDSKLVNSITKSKKVKEFFQDEIVSITPVSLKVPEQPDKNESESNLEDNEDETESNLEDIEHEAENDLDDIKHEAENDLDDIEDEAENDLEGIDDEAESDLEGIDDEAESDVESEDQDQNDSETEVKLDEKGDQEESEDLTEDGSETEKSTSENEYELDHNTEVTDENEQFEDTEAGSSIEADNQEIDVNTSVKSDRANLSDGVFVSESEPDTSADIRLKSTVHKIVRNLESGSKSDSSPIKQSRSSGSNNKLEHDDESNNSFSVLGNILVKSNKVSTPASNKKSKKRSNGSDSNMSAKKGKERLFEIANSESDIEEKDITNNVVQNSNVSDENDLHLVKQSRKDKDSKQKTPSSDRKKKNKREILNMSSQSETDNDLIETNKDKTETETVKAKQKISKELNDESDIDDKENLIPENLESHVVTDQICVGETEKDEDGDDLIPNSPNTSTKEKRKSVYIVKSNEKTEQNKMDSSYEESSSKVATQPSKKARKSSSQSESPHATPGKKTKSHEEDHENNANSSAHKKKKNSHSTKDGLQDVENVYPDNKNSKAQEKSSAKKKRNSGLLNDEFDKSKDKSEDSISSETDNVTSAKKKKKKSKNIGEDQNVSKVEEDSGNMEGHVTKSAKKKQDFMSVTDIFVEGTEACDNSADSEIDTVTPSGKKIKRKNKSIDKELDESKKGIEDPSNSAEDVESSSAKKKKRKSKSINEELDDVSHESDRNSSGLGSRKEGFEIESPKRRKIEKENIESADNSFTKIIDKRARSSGTKSEMNIEKCLDNYEEIEKLVSPQDKSNTESSDSMETSVIIETSVVSSVSEKENNTPRKKKKGAKKRDSLTGKNSETTPLKYGDESRKTEENQDRHDLVSKEIDKIKEVMPDKTQGDNSSVEQMQNKSIIVSSDDSDMEISEVPDLKQHLKPFTFVTEKVALPQDVYDDINKSDVADSDRDDVEIINCDSDRDSANETVIDTLNREGSHKKTHKKYSPKETKSPVDNANQSSTVFKDLSINLDSTTSESRGVSELSDLESIDSKSGDIGLVIAESDIESITEANDTNLTLVGSPKGDETIMPIENKDSAKGKSQRLSLRKSPRSSELEKESLDEITGDSTDLQEKGKDSKLRRSLRRSKSFENKENGIGKSPPDIEEEKYYSSDNQDSKSPGLKPTRKSLENKYPVDELQKESGEKSEKSPTKQKIEKEDFQELDKNKSKSISPKKRRSLRKMQHNLIDELKTVIDNVDESSPTKQFREDEHIEMDNEDLDFDTDIDKTESKPSRKSSRQQNLNESNDKEKVESEIEPNNKSPRKQKALAKETAVLEPRVNAKVSPRKQSGNEKDKDNEVKDIDTYTTDLVTCDAELPNRDAAQMDQKSSTSPSKATDLDDRDKDLDCHETKLKSPKRSTRKQKSDKADDNDIAKGEAEIESCPDNNEQQSPDKEDNEVTDMDTEELEPKSRRSLRKKPTDKVDEHESLPQPDEVNDCDVEINSVQTKRNTRRKSLRPLKPDKAIEQETENDEPEVMSTTRRSLRQHKPVAGDDNDTDVFVPEVTSSRRSLRQRKSSVVNEPDTDTDTDTFVKKPKRSTKKESAPNSDSKQRSTGSKSVFDFTSESDTADSDLNANPRPRRSVLFKTAMEGIEENEEGTDSGSVDEKNVAKTPIGKQRPRALSASTSKKVVKKEDKRVSLRKRRLSGELLASETKTLEQKEVKPSMDDKDKDGKPSPKLRRTSQRRKQPV